MIPGYRNDEMLFSLARPGMNDDIFSEWKRRGVW